MEIDRPDVVVQVRAAFDLYEQALLAGDLGTLADLFWGSAQVRRFGINDEQTGSSALAAWRATQAPLPAGRSLSRTVVTTFGADTAVVTTHFSYPGRPAVGRQSQTWVRLCGHWRIVHAHVSEIPWGRP